MNARFNTTFNEERLEVEISSNGELSFPGYKEMLEYDIAVVAMGGKPTAAMELLDAWLEDPVKAICNDLGLDHDTLVRLAADWAEHGLGVFEQAFPEDKRPRLAIEATRDFLDGKITRAQLKASGAASAAWAAVDAAAEAAAAWAAEAAADAAASGASAAWAAGAAWAAAADPKQERCWQVRHFVHVMGCLQAGKNRPKTKETP